MCVHGNIDQFNIIETGKKIRIKDIARLAGVSIGTVDRVIHNRGEVSEKTREKITRIIKKLNYEPDVLASALATRKKTHFAVLIPSVDQESTFWKYIKSGIDKAYNELGIYGVEIDFFEFSQFDKSAFTNQFDRVLSSDPQAVLMAPVFYDEALEFVERCSGLGKNVVFINANIEKAKILSFVGQDSRQSGYVAAKLLTYGLNDPGEILIVNISQALDNHKHILKRKTGFLQFIEDKGLTHIKTRNLDIEETDESIVHSKLNTILKRTNDIKAIFVTNSKVYKVANFLTKQGISHIRMIGYDLIEENLPFLENNTIDFLISQNPIVQGYNSISVLFNHEVLKRQINRNYLLPIDIVTKENIQYYIQ